MSGTYYRTCPDCGCNLDPGERCDCQSERDVRVVGKIVPEHKVVISSQNDFPTMSDVLIIGYDRSRGEDMACMSIARKNNDRILILKELFGAEAIKEYENLTMGPCINYDPQMHEFLKKNFNVPCEPRKQQTTFK